MTNYSIEQTRFFQKLREELALDKLSGWLSELLEIDSSNAYRRISGEKQLTFAEYLKICKQVPGAENFLIEKKQPANHFQSSLHHFSNWDELRSYYQGLIRQFRIAEKAVHTLYYSGSDLPIFFYHFNEDLLRYKISIWIKYGGLKIKGEVPKDIVAMGTELFKIYQQLNTEEIWYTQGVMNQLEQLRHSVEMDDLKGEELELLIHSFRKVIDWYVSQLANGYKKEGRLKLYLSDFHIMNDGGLLNINGHETLMNRFQGIYFLRSEEARLIQIFKEHWQAHTSISQLVSGQNEKSRYAFFKRIKSMLKQLKPD